MYFCIFSLSINLKNNVINNINYVEDRITDVITKIKLV